MRGPATALLAAFLGTVAALALAGSAGSRPAAKDCGRRDGRLVPCTIRLVYTGTAEQVTRSPGCGAAAVTGTVRLTWNALWARKFELRYGNAPATLASLVGSVRIEQPACGQTPAVTCSARLVVPAGALPFYSANHIGRLWRLGVLPFTGVDTYGGLRGQPCRAVPPLVNAQDALGIVALIEKSKPKRRTRVYPVGGTVRRGTASYGSVFRFTGAVTVTGVW